MDVFITVFCASTESLPSLRQVVRTEMLEVNELKTADLNKGMQSGPDSVQVDLPYL
jgi:hypothetical protein